MFYKRTAITLYLLIIWVIVLSCGRTKTPKPELMEADKAVIEVGIAGMTCTGCEQKIQAGISQIPGIKSVKASYIEGNAIVEYYLGKADTSEIRHAVQKAGYSVKKIYSSPSADIK